MIRVQDVLEAYGLALAGNAALKAWCLATYNTPLTVHVGEDGSDPAGPGARPIIVLTIVRPYETGESVDARRMFIEVDWELYDKSKSVRDNLTVFSGVYRADDMGQMIYAALKAVPSNVALSQVDYFIDAHTTWPVVHGGMTVCLEFPNVIGAEVTFS